ncbi:TerC family protein [Permianibacter sp. IMCC34836]|uniref:TerC family protein n=1 Tax=Permianibacter fluminis TaxID=2738515 RepID=UPI001556CCFA|nr:TerC family protein [Permianibacter fluminis]NQD36591.1 TerC family protein [Permianibacter fluminis]
MESIGNIWLWSGFSLFVLFAVALDLRGVKKHEDEVVSFKQALWWSLLWVGLALLFCAGLWLWLDATAGRELAHLKASEFLTGYVIEKSLSVDNLFVFLMIFTAFRVPPVLQREAIVIGVIGAIILRVIMILIGAWLIAKFHWILYLFGAFLLVTGVKMLVFADAAPDLETNPVLKWMRGHLRITNDYRGMRLWVQEAGYRFYTPLFLVVVLIGVTDIIFAVDSIPAIFAITTDPFIVMTSNIFAILGLRALFFLLAGMAEKFRLLKYGLALVLAFIGVKMLLLDVYKIPVAMSLGVVLFLLIASMLASVWASAERSESRARKQAKRQHGGHT